ncbi:MAG: hypothetical protein KF836_09115 [Fimbriimonadaceae bacterium]|nr:hypothetical protein [Fimbriimonadaceae bacterium]
MKWGIAVLVGLCLVACGPKSDKMDPDEAAKQAGLRRDQYSHQGEGNQVVTGADGTTTAILEESNFADFGLGVYPGVGEKKGNAYRHTAGNTVTTSYTLHAKDDPKKVIAFYETELKSQARSGGELGSVIAGRLGDKSGMVSVMPEGATGSKIEVQIIEETKD